MIHKGIKNILDYYTQNSIEDLDIYQNICRVYLDEYEEQEKLRADWIFHTALYKLKKSHSFWSWFIKKRFEERQ